MERLEQLVTTPCSETTLSGPHFGNDALDRADPDPQVASDGADALPLPPRGPYSGLGFHRHLRATEPLPLCPGPRQACANSLLDQGSLELSKDPEHLEHCPAGRGVGVEALLMQVQVDALGVQLAEEGDEVLQGATN